jgi:U3 small nucleolar RNA-associated protein 25
VTFISEDTDKKDWQRNRLFFEEGRFKFLLFSERAHFYKKINLKFAKNIFFYSLPEDPTIFNEMIDLIAPQHYKDSLEKYKIEDKTLQAENYSAVIALVTKMERYNLEKILGWKTCSYIFKSKTDKYIC